MNKVEEFISTIRDSIVGSQEIYTGGSCYHFYKILKFVFPEAEAFYDQDHVVTKIDGNYYDITGKISPDPNFENYENILPHHTLTKPFNIYKK